jgi:DNA-binding beta-propeller fold protein YncE
MSLFSMSSGQAHVRLVQAGAVLVTAVMIAGCGAGYRPVVTPINPSGPAAQPTALAAVVSAPSPTSPGIATIIDYSGDTIVAQASIGPGPTTFTVDESGTSGYTVNSDGTLTNFPVTSQLQAKNVTYTTLPSTAVPIQLFSPSAGLWAADLTGNVTDVLTGSPQTFKLSVPVAATPVAVIGSSLIGQRNYAITQGNVATGVACNTSPTTGPLGEADAIEVASYTVSARIPLGKCPVYAVQSSDGRRLFVMNRGDDTVTVINSQNNVLDNQCPPPTGCVNQGGQTYFSHPTLPLSTTAVTATGITPPNGTTGMGTIAGPVYAEYNIATSQLVVANYDGGTVSVIDVSLDEYGNDSQTFGTTFTIPVGTNPASVTALYDGSRAYTANQNDSTVSIVNLTSHSFEKTLPVIGHPRTVVSVQNSLYGKVYVASPDSPYLTIIRTDQDIVDTTVLVEGNIVDVRVSNQNGVSTNVNNTSRKPGYGQPCYQPPTVLTNAAITATPSACWTLPVAP